MWLQRPSSSDVLRSSALRSGFFVRGHLVCGENVRTFLYAKYCHGIENVLIELLITAYTIFYMEEW